MPRGLRNQSAITSNFSFIYFSTRHQFCTYRTAMLALGFILFNSAKEVVRSLYVSSRSTMNQKKCDIYMWTRYFGRMRPIAHKILPNACRAPPIRVVIISYPGMIAERSGSLQLEHFSAVPTRFPCCTNNSCAPKWDPYRSQVPFRPK